ncbi:hypothetical protein DICPUDRAFT_154969 [Dictyostelium purpureum]|uniref:ABC transporter domain-containing protein n=1 Tax=Dictyostelium purpureum TaxID=5786 RepID=F0ZSQ8_DICPU|nr:uncharacterized protein DICPUDRAFT_154969 [Dictyostelium purpureum]EGC33020.1 hypothetical protein DICPUDRAFT_154969 [Dictyostelium purpureum]|eukprot:XP_003290447.1 hypothetical protein DICPUDRAFT_154969 [Dictyostelium purpureum]
MELINIPNSTNNINISNNNFNSNNNNNTKGVQLTFKNITYKVENRKYKKQLKKQTEARKKKNDDYESNNKPASFTDIKVEKELTILNNVSGVIEKGELCALMGPSGSGKSTLLDILAERKSTGKITGKLLINGKEVGDAYKKFCSYVTQEDVLLQTATVFETIKFYADLKLPEMAEEEKIKRVEQVIEDVGLTKRRDSKVGGILPGGIIMKGLSGGEKRRVSIGCGLVTNPSLIFLDEPTSGLDSVTALSIMKTLLDLTKTKGCTIIASIHQPRGEIFELFNKVMVVIKGKMIYSGNNILQYFEQLGYTCPNNMNPADFCLDAAVEIGDGDRYDEICTQWQKIWENEIVNEITQPFIAVEKPKATPWSYQYYILLKRSWKDFLRNQGNFIARVGTAIVTGLLFGACFAGLKETEADVQKIIGVIFFLITGLNLTPFAVISLFLSQRTLFNAERASKVYHSFPYYLAMVTVETFVVLLVALINATICYLIAHLRWDASYFFYAMMIYFFVHLLSDFLICTLANLTGTSDMTFAYGSGFCVIFMLFAGFYVPVQELPVSFGWLHYINPLFYSFVSLMQVQFKDLPIKCSQPANSTIPCQFNNGNQVLSYYGIDEWSRDESFGIVILWAAFFFTTSYLALHYLNREKR